MRKLLAACAMLAVAATVPFLVLRTPAGASPPASPSASPSDSASPSASPSDSASPSPSPSASTSMTPSPSPSGPSSLTIHVAPAAAVWGTAFTIAGTLTCFGAPVAGASLQVQRRIGGTYTFDALANATTNASGVYAVTRRPDQSADYRAIVPGGTGACAVSTSPTARGNVRVGVATNVTQARIPRGARARIQGWALPAHRGKKVYLQVLQGRSGSWFNASVAALDASSQYTLTYPRSTPGFLLFRVVFPTQDLNHMWNAGRNVGVDWT